MKLASLVSAFGIVATVLAGCASEDGPEPLVGGSSTEVAEGTTSREANGDAPRSEAIEGAEVAVTSPASPIGDLSALPEGWEAEEAANVVENAQTPQNASWPSSRCGVSGWATMDLYVTPKPNSWTGFRPINPKLARLGPASCQQACNACKSPFVYDEYMLWTNGPDGHAYGKPLERCSCTAAKF
jgi:hypothetical protein